MLAVSEGVCGYEKNSFFRTKIIDNTMRLILIAILTLSLVVCLTSCSSENEIEVYEDELLEEIPDREKRDAIPQPIRGIFFTHLVIYLW